MLLLPGSTGLPDNVKKTVKDDWTVTVGVPSALLKDWEKTNEKLLRPTDVPELSGSLQKPVISSTGTSQALELTGELLQWLMGEGKQKTAGGAVTMLNLLTFKDGRLHAEYLKYGKAFAESVGIRRGGTAKIVGRVVEGQGGAGSPGGEGSGKGWDEIALAHYPSTVHFADMVGSEDYQEANKRWRVGSLEDTCILCCSEIVGYEGAEKTKL
jgi:hypothetical protein